MKKGIKALKFFESVKARKELNKYKLVNGLFIVRYINKDVCVYVGQFWKVGSVFNNTKDPLILIADSENPPQQFNKEARLTRRFFKADWRDWKPLNIGFREKPISEILD